MSTTLDELTGLLTIKSFTEQLEAAIKTGEPLTIVRADLDRFLSFNQKYGHAGGDEWIKVIAGMFKEAFAGEGNLVSRYHGDEFMAAIRGSDASRVFQQAEALRQRVEKEKPAFTLNGEEIRPGYTISLGLAVFPTHAGNANDLVDKTDQALRRAKITGGNRVCFYQDTDYLTGLLSPSAIRQALDETAARARENNHSLSVITFDLDRFKEINDEYGHRVGDEVLKRFAHILDSNFPGVPETPGVPGAPASSKVPGIAGRLGGEEFLVILPGQSADSAFILADEIRRLVEDSELPITLGASGQDARTFNLRFHISGGVASIPGDASEAVDLLRKADEALFRSKRTGRNRISLPASSQMVTKTSYYSQTQLERLSQLARKLDKTEAFLLREALDDLLRKYEDPYVV
jgi:diguanylate cyclase (GGDEF)-like protein